MTRTPKNSPKTARLLAHYKAFVDTLPTMGLLALPNGKIKHVNSWIPETLGYTADDLLRFSSLFELFANQDPTSSKTLHQLFKTGNPYSGIRIMLICQNGQNIASLLSFHAIKNSKGKIVFYLILLQETPYLEILQQNHLKALYQLKTLKQDLETLTVHMNRILLPRFQQTKDLIGQSLLLPKISSKNLTMIYDLTETLDGQLRQIPELLCWHPPSSPQCIKLNIKELIDEIIASPGFFSHMQIVIDSTLPTFTTNAFLLKMVFEKALRSMTYSLAPENKREIHIFSEELCDYYVFSIKAHGIFEAQGLDLLIAQKIITHQEGHSHFTVNPAKGLCFSFAWKKMP